MKKKKLLGIVYKVVRPAKNAPLEMVSMCASYPKGRVYAVPYHKGHVTKPSIPNSRLFVFTELETAQYFAKEQSRHSIILKCLARNITKPEGINTVVIDEAMIVYWDDFNAGNDGLVMYQSLSKWASKTHVCTSLIPLKEV